MADIIRSLLEADTIRCIKDQNDQFLCNNKHITKVEFEKFLKLLKTTHKIDIYYDMIYEKNNIEMNIPVIYRFTKYKSILKDN